MSALEIRGLKTLLREAPKRARASGNRQQRFLATDPLILKGRIPGFAPVRIEIDRQRRVLWKAYRTLANGERVEDTERPILLRGRLHVGRRHTDLYQGWLPVAVAILEGDAGPTLRVRFRGQGRRKAPRFYELRGKLTGSSERIPLRITRVLRGPFDRKRCGAHLPPQAVMVSARRDVSPRQHEPGGPQQDELRIAEISTEADPEWFALFGSNSNAEIASIIDAVDVIYQRDLGVSLSILQQNVHEKSSPYDGITNANIILDQFVMSGNSGAHLGAADVFHLFSGKEFDSYLGGLAYIGAVCREPKFSYGISMNLTPALNTIVVAHEVGHNFGANHDFTSASPGVMGAVANVANDFFSEFSKNEILTHISNFGSCLDVRVSQWLLSMTKQKAGRRKTNLVVQLFTERNGVGSGRMVDLYRVTARGERFVRSGVTDEHGQVVFGSYRRGKRNKRFLARFENGSSFASEMVRIRRRKR